MLFGNQAHVLLSCAANTRTRFQYFDFNLDGRLAFVDKLANYKHPIRHHRGAHKAVVASGSTEASQKLACPSFVFLVIALCKFSQCLYAHRQKGEQSEQRFCARIKASFFVAEFFSNLLNVAVSASFCFAWPRGATHAMQGKNHHIVHHTLSCTCAYTCYHVAWNRMRNLRLVCNILAKEPSPVTSSSKNRRTSSSIPFHMPFWIDRHL